MRSLRCCVFLCVLSSTCEAIVDAFSIFGGGRRVGDFSSESGLTTQLERRDRTKARLGLLARSGSVRHRYRPHQATFSRRAFASEFCPTYRGGGYHSGKSEAELGPTQAPNGVMWTWEECARECAKRDECQFWTFKIQPGNCLIMSRQGKHHNNTGGHIEGPRDSACLKAQPSGPFAGEYEVHYSRGQVRDQSMTVHCNGSVSQPGVLTDFTKSGAYDFLMAASPTIQCLRREPRSTIFIFNTKDSSKFECLMQEGMSKLRGSRYYSSGQLFGDVEYRLAKSFNCSYEYGNGTTEMLIETVNEVTEDDSSEGELSEDAVLEDAGEVEQPDDGGSQQTAGQTVDPSTGVEAEAYPAEAWSKEEAAEAESKEEDERKAGEAAAAAELAAKQRAAQSAAAAAEKARQERIIHEKDEEISRLIAEGSRLQLRQAPAAAVSLKAAPPAAEEALPAVADEPEKQPEQAEASTTEAAAELASAKQTAGSCMAWCPPHEAAWDKKCKFVRCRGCSECGAEAAPEDGSSAASSTTGLVEPTAGEEQPYDLADRQAAKAGKEAGGSGDDATNASAQEVDQGSEATSQPVQLQQRQGQSLKVSSHHKQRASGDGPGASLASRAERSGMPRTWQEASMAQYLGWSLDAGLTKIKENVDAHWLKIRSLSEELQGSNRTNASLAEFLGHSLAIVSGRREELGRLMNASLHEMKESLSSTGHATMLPALEDCLEANSQASALSTWFFGLAGLAGSESFVPDEAAPEMARERIGALNTNGMEYKHHEDALASSFRSAFAQLVDEIKLPTAAAAVPEAKRQLDELLEHVLQKATGVAWDLHTSAMDLLTLVKMWAADAESSDDGL